MIREEARVGRIYMKASFVVVMNTASLSIFLSLFEKDRDIQNTCSTDTNGNFASLLNKVWPKFPESKFDQFTGLATFSLLSFSADKKDQNCSPFITFILEHIFTPETKKKSMFLTSEKLCFIK